MCMQSKCACLVFSTVHMSVHVKLLKHFEKLVILECPCLFMLSSGVMQQKIMVGLSEPPSVLFFESVA